MKKNFAIPSMNVRSFSKGSVITMSGETNRAEALTALANKEEIKSSGGFVTELVLK